LGETCTVADGYLFTVAGWGRYVGVDFSGLSHLMALVARVAARPAVQEALKAEGLLKG
jgi:glutathione S-transferase